MDQRPERSRDDIAPMGKSAEGDRLPNAAPSGALRW